MDINSKLLICAALLPAIILGRYVYKKDRVEKEPMGLLIGLFCLGCVICVPAAIVETVLEVFIDDYFVQYGVALEDGIYLDGIIYEIYTAVNCFVGIGLVEEGLKFVVLYFVTRKNKNFNSLFDGIVYAVFVSLGFAALENVLYVLENGWGNAIVRAVMSVPGHTFFGVLMGYYYSLWHMYEKAREQEQALKRNGLIAPNAMEFSGEKYLWLSLIIPTLAHGLYDYGCMSEMLIATIVFFAFLIFLYIYCFKKIKSISKADTDDVTYSGALVSEKYPHLAEQIAQNSEENTETTVIGEV